MKVLKKQGLMLMLIAALVVTLTLGIIFMLPARTAMAEEAFIPKNTVHVSTEQQLKEEVAKAGATATKIILDDDIEMVTPAEVLFIRGFYLYATYYGGLEIIIEQNQNIQIDLAGHTLSTGMVVSARGQQYYMVGSLFVILNKGTLSIIDSSDGKTGEVLTNGFIEAYQDYEDYSWIGGSVIYNCGELTVDANLKFAQPQSTEVGTDGYYTRPYGPNYYIYNTLYIPTEEERAQGVTASQVSLTVNSGDFDLSFNGSLMRCFFCLEDADLTINGGTFYNSATNQYPENSGFLAEMFTIDLLQTGYDYKSYPPDVFGTLTNDMIKEYRHTDITINGGDFRGKNLLPTFSSSGSDSLLKMDSKYGKDYSRNPIEGEEYEISISGGTFPSDFSAYTDKDHTMVEIEEPSGYGEDESYWMVISLSQEEKDEKPVVIEQNGEITGYYNTFKDAWTAAMLMKSDKTIKLRQNVSIDETLKLNPESKNTTLDLNGHSLTITSPVDSFHITFATNTISEGYFGALTLLDSSKAGGGELILNYPEGATKGGIEINKAFQFVLESGTIRLTGTSPTQPTAEKKYGFALFHIDYSKVSEYYHKDDAVIIKGGNIVSELSDIEFAGWKWRGTEYGDKYSLGLDSNGDDWEPWGELEGFSKTKTVRLDAKAVEAYLKKASSMKLSWNLTAFLPEGYDCKLSDGSYFITKLEEGANYSDGTTTYSTWEQACNAVKGSGGTVTLLHSMQEEGEIEVPANVTLDLNRYLHYTFTATSVKLNAGSSLINGTVIGNVIVNGAATLSDLTVNGNVTVNGAATLSDLTIGGDVTMNGAATLSNPTVRGNLIVGATSKVTISNGTYDGEIIVNEGGKLLLRGGKIKGYQEKYDNYVLPGFAATDAADEYKDEYKEVKAGYVSAAAQAWYEGQNAAGASLRDAGQVYTIDSEEAWLYFTSYVNSGTDNFENDTVVLGKNLDFGNYIFLPAGNATHEFKGTFNGMNGNTQYTITHITAQEKYVGLFGKVGSAARIKNVFISDSSFVTGEGFLNEFNNDSYYAGGAIAGEGTLSSSENNWSGNITLNNVQVRYGISGKNYIGGVIGHSHSDVKIDGIKFMNKTTVSSNFKMGGVVGYVGGTFHLKNADIEKGSEEDGNGLILDDKNCTFFAAGALVGHANGGKNVIEDCKVLEPEDSLIGTTYAGGTNCDITIKGSETELDIYRVVGSGHTGGKTEVELTQDVTEDGVKRGSVKLQEADNGLKFYETDETGKRTELDVQPNAGDSFEAVAKLDVTIGGLKMNETVTFSGADTVITINKVAGFTLFDKFGNPVKSEMIGDVIISVTLELSKCTVGKRMALITSYTITGADAKNFNFQLSGNQTFIEVEVTAKTLQVSVNSNGEVEYDGFVGGEDESVLGGSLTLDKVDNGDGTYTVTPSGLESENYNIVYVSSVVPATAFESNSNALWIALAVVGSAILLLGAVAVVYAVRKRKE